MASPWHSHDEYLLHGVPESAGQLLQRAREQGRDVGSRPVQRHRGRLGSAHPVSWQLGLCVGRLHNSPECGEFEADVVDAEGAPVRQVLRSPERGACVAAEGGVLREQCRQAGADDAQHLRFLNGRAKVEQPLQLVGHVLRSATLIVELTAQPFTLDSHVRQLQLQGPDFGITAQELALFGKVRRFLQDQRLGLFVCHGVTRYARPLINGRLRFLGIGKFLRFFFVGD